MYAPSQITEYTLALEGNFVPCILTGVYFAISGINISLLWKKRNIILFVYSIVQLAITVLYFAMSQYADPGQSLTIFNITGLLPPGAKLSAWPEVVVNVTFFLNTWISDAFLLYRCHAIYLGNRHALALPALLYLASVGSSIATFVASPTSTENYMTSVSHTKKLAGFCYWICSIATNACTSCLICVQLRIHQKKISKILGSQREAFYRTYVVMTIESTLLYTTFVIATGVTILLHSSLELVPMQLLGAIQVIAPSLVVHRIARGFQAETNEDGSLAIESLQFALSV